jgi:nucleoid DNA-binding protein
MTIYVKDLADAIVGTDVSNKAKACEVLQAMFAKILDQVNAGNKVYVTDFGEFELVEKAARKARNPKTGEIVDVAAYKKLEFTPVKELRRIR